MDDVERVIAYHDRTKHLPHRYARSLGYLDWATQPNPFRRFEGAPLVPLEPPTEDDTPAYDDLYVPGRIDSADVSARSISRLFECSLAISAWKQAGMTRWALRCNPSSGNLHPTEGYLVIGSQEGLGDRPGVYHYAPELHALERRTEFAQADFDELTAPFGSHAFLVGLSSVHWREAWKYGERAFRYCQHDVGHALGALRLAAAALGWKLTMLEALADSDVARLLGLNRREDFDEAEAEHPDLVAVVRPDRESRPVDTGLDRNVVARIAAGQWTGRANRLSRDHVEWPIIDAVAEATVKPRSPIANFVASGTSVDQTPTRSATIEGRQVTAHRIFRERRSAVAFDGRTGIAAATFYAILSRVVVRANSVPWDAISWPAQVHLFLFVHRVDGLPPGHYALLRNADHLTRLRQATRPESAWTRPSGCPDDLPLYRLVEADCRESAAFLSLGQAIGGDGAFSLGMVANFEATLRDHGPWFYRRLFWEAGLVGQVLYLEAEAAGIRATGIGAYFDDLVHEAFGLSGHAFQSLYHFTMGSPVDDVRLTTLPAYSWSGEPTG